MEQTGLAARRAALALLHAVLEERRTLAEALPELDALPVADRARAQRLAVTTLRAMGRADRLLDRHLRKAPPLRARNVLRLATVELCAEGAADHGVVNAAVTLVGESRRTAHLRGLVNAVLRKVAAEGPGAWNRLPMPQMPRWIRRPLAQAWGETAIARIEAAQFRGAPLDVTPKRDAAAVAEALGGTLLPTGSVRIADPGQVTALPGYAAGDWWVQDAAAAIPARMLAVQPGETVLDLCAAPGGKTLQLAAAGAAVTALDLSEARLRRLRDNLERTGLAAEIVVADALTWQGGSFDAILLDAPCSATGTIRRHPDLPFARDGSDFAALIALQEAMIDAAWRLLKPGGRIVFCTCSLLPDEGECQTEAALERLPGAVVDARAARLPGVDPDWISAEGGLRLRPDYWPELGGMDGFYAVCLRKAQTPA